MGEFCAMTPKQIFLREATGLVRNFSMFDAFNLNLGTVSVMVGTLYLFSWLSFVYPGANLIISLTLIAGLAVIEAVVYSILSSAMPRSGGDYVWVGRILHPALGLMDNMFVLFAATQWLAFAASWLPTYALSPFLTILGTNTSNLNLVSLGQQLATPTWSFIVGTIGLAYVALLMILGGRYFANVQKILFIITNIGMLAMIITMATTPHQNFVDAINAVGRSTSVTFNGIMKSATTSGYVPGWTLSGTILSLPFVYSFYAGYNCSAYVGGEVRDVKKNMPIAIIGSLVVACISAVVLAAAMFASMGYDFFNGLNYLYLANPNSYPSQVFILQPSINYLFTFVTNNQAIVYLVLFAYIANGLWFLPTNVVLGSRNMFAWAFDRILPAKLAEVGDRFHSPHYAIILIVLVAEFNLYLSSFTTVLAFTANLVLGWFIAKLITAIAAASFPWRRKELYEATVPPNYRRKILGLPMISIAGVLYTIFSLGMIYGALTNAAIGGVIAPTTLIEGVLSVYVLAAVLYYVAKYYRMKQGLNLSQIMSEIPAE